MADYLNSSVQNDMASLLPNGLISDEDWITTTTMNHRVPEFVPSSFSPAHNASHNSIHTSAQGAVHNPVHNAGVNADPVFSSAMMGMNDMMNGFQGMSLDGNMGGGMHSHVGAGSMDGSMVHMANHHMGGHLGTHMGGQMGIQMGNQMGAHHMGGQMGSHIGSQMGSHMGSQMGSHMGGQMNSQMSGQMNTQLGGQIGAQMGGQMGSQLNQPTSVAAPVSNNYMEVNTIMADGGHKYGVTSLAFDHFEELLWMGNGGGHVTSYFGAGLQKYTSFQIASTAEEILHILPTDNSVLALTRDSLIARQRTGMPIYVFKSEHLTQAQSMLQMDPTVPNVIISGQQPNIVELDFTTKQEIRAIRLDDENGRVVLRRSQKYLMAGDASGRVTMHDPRTLRQEHVIDVHSGALSDLDVHGTTLATVGFSTRGPSGTLFGERFIKVYDIRFMRSTSPIQIHIAPLFLRCLPLFSAANFLVLSQHGQFQIVEPSGLAGSFQVSNAGTIGMSMMCLDVSSNYSCLAMGDSMGLVHLFTNSGNMIDPTPFNVYSRPTTFADPMETYPPIPFTDIMSPLSMIPNPITNGKLVSDWPSFTTKKVYRVPEPTHPELMENMKMVQGIGYAARPPWMRRNMNMHQPRNGEVVPRKGGARPNHSTSISPQERSSPYASSASGSQIVTIPKKYQKVELKYSKIGLEDFDFRLYNRTSFAGLETDIPNSYCNSMLQVLFYLEPLRCYLLQHLCNREFCLSCELSFLFHMLDNTKGNTCQATNFLRAFRTIPEASALSLILADADEETGKANLPGLIQSWNRFILQQIYSETTTPPPAPPPVADAEYPFRMPEIKESSPEVRSDHDVVNDISRLFSMRTINIFTCREGCRVTKETSTMVTSLSYPDCYPDGESAPPKQIPFIEVVKHSLDYTHHVTAFCEKCSKYMSTTQQRKPITIPDNLTLNCQVVTGKDLQFWKAQIELLNGPEEENEAEKYVTDPNVPACRFGARCKRGDCRYRHDTGPDRSSGESKPKVAYIPTEFKIRIHPRTKELQIKPLSPADSKIEAAEDREEIIKDAERGGGGDNGDDTDFAPWPQGGGWQVYQLGGNIMHIHENSPLKPGGSLVAHIFVGEKAHKRKEGITSTQWYVFNDFSIEPIEEHEGRVVDLNFMTPTCIFYRRKNMEKSYDLQPNYESIITSDVLTETGITSAPYLQKRRLHVTFTPLGPEEVVSPGYLVGLDAEFVTLNQEESEIRSDGTRSTLKPSQMTCARITCIRGQGPLEGVPFIDDYISTQEQVVDYLTEFSGIKPGDLDANISCKHLTTLKSSYLKLRYLISRGVTFVGHGLKKDFRVINLVVPKKQVFDTVTLFHLPKQRMISLKFLAWYLLATNIQEDTHDSIEDARTALKLYRKYKALSEDQIGFQDVLKNLYEEGRKYGWKVPSAHQ